MGHEDSRRAAARQVWLAPLSVFFRVPEQGGHKMRTARAVFAVGACVIVTIATLQGDRRASFVYHEVVVPGALSVDAQGINARGDIVGGYRDAAGRNHGYLWKRGEVTTIDYPGAAFTLARGISPRGDIVGNYRMPGEPAVNSHGYLLKRDGTFVNIDYPGHTNTVPQRILPDGTILGCLHDTDMMMTMRGVLMGRRGNEETDAFASMHNGATPDAELIVGFFRNMMTDRVEGYVIEDGEFTPFVVPGSIQTGSSPPGFPATAAWDVNPRGEIVGVYTDPAGRLHGFVRDDDDYLTLDVPGATATRAFGINAGGDVVGAFVDGAGVTRAFIASRTPRHNKNRAGRHDR
jgi:uncharacterized membrane protein